MNESIPTVHIHLSIDCEHEVTKVIPCDCDAYGVFPWDDSIDGENKFDCSPSRPGDGNHLADFQAFFRPTGVETLER